MTIGFWCSTISATGLLLTSFYIYGKSGDYKELERYKLLSIFWCLACAVFFSASLMPGLVIRTLFCILSIIFIWMLHNEKFDVIVSAYLISFGISNALFYIAGLPIGISFMPFLGADISGDTLVDFNKPIYLLYYTLIAALQFFLAFLIFRFRRFKRGFPFLFGRYTVVIALIAAGSVLILVSVFTAQEDYSQYAVLIPIVGILIVGVGIYIWIRRGIKSFYKKWAKQHNEELYQQEITKLTREIERLKELCEVQRVENHKIIHRQTAWERGVADLAGKVSSLGLSAEISEELAVSLKDIRRLAREYQAGTGRVKRVHALPSTNIQLVDDMFMNFAETCFDANIDFDLKVSGSVIHMAETVIRQSNLETLIGDHLQDALIAVNKSDHAARVILAMIGAAGEHYEFSVSDSGVPFTVDTLARLGTEYVTTHADTGGSGTGFMTSFETMQDCGASLIIDEQEPGVSYTKTVTFRFDGQNQYTIKTHRPGEFPASERYTVIGRVRTV